jgi:hypothetical protein
MTAHLVQHGDDRSVPTIMADRGRRLIGLADLPRYRELIEDAGSG